MSLDSSLKTIIDSGFSNQIAKKELKNKLDDNKLTGTEISLIENEIEKSDPKNADKLVKQFESELKSKLDIDVPSVKESNFNANSFEFKVDIKKFVKEKDEKTPTDIKTDVFVDKTPEKIDNIGNKVKPIITDHKNDVENLQIKKSGELKKEDYDTFKRAFPDIKTVPPVLDQKASDDFSQKVFGMKTQDLQKIIGEAGNSGKISAKTMFLMKEYMAKMANSPKNLEDCQKVADQLDKFKNATNGINHDNRFLEIEKTISLKSTNILHDEIYNTTFLKDLEKTASKIDSLKVEPKEKERLKSILSDRTTGILKEKIPQANMAELQTISEFIAGKGDSISPADKSLLKNNIGAAGNKMLSERFNKIENSNDCLMFKYAIDKMAGSVDADSINSFREQLGRKSVLMIDKELKAMKDPKISECDSVAYNFNHLKDIIPKGSVEPLKNSLDVKNRIANIYGEKGLDFKDVNQGEIGDCYFVTALAGMAKHRPEDLKKMISYNDDCSIIFVKFPGQKDAIGVKYPTREELDKYAREGKNGGVWASAVEKAYAYVTAFRDGQGHKSDPIKNISNGGQLSEGVNILTNNDTDQDILMLTRDNTTRHKLTEALKNNKLVGLATGGSSDRRLVDGIPQDHAFTVLNYDPKTDKITIRNPWGDGDSESYRGKGNDGIFEISFSELNKYFSTIDYEE